MSNIQQLNFKYFFSIDQYAGKDFIGGAQSKLSITDVNNFCREKCQHQWAIITPQNNTIKCYCSPVVKETFNGTHFPVSSINIESSFVIAFEHEQDAMLFKLTYLHNNEVQNDD